MQPRLRGYGQVRAVSFGNYRTDGAPPLVGICLGYEVFQDKSGEFFALDENGKAWTGKILVGTDGGDHLRGTSDPDLILGLGGNDRLFGRKGADII